MGTDDQPHDCNYGSQNQTILGLKCTTNRGRNTRRMGPKSDYFRIEIKGMIYLIRSFKKAKIRLF